MGSSAYVILIAIVYLILLVFAWDFFVSESIQDWTQEHCAKKEISILTANVHFLPNLFTKKNKAKRMAKEFETTGADVVCLQECWHVAGFNAIASLLPSHKYVLSPSTDPCLVASGLVVLSKLPVRLIEFIPFRTVTTLDKFCRKGIMVFLVDKKLTILHSHFPYDMYNPYEQDETSAIEQLAAAVHRYGKCVVTGDLNIKWHSESYRKLLHKTGLTEPQNIFSTEFHVTTTPFEIVDYVFCKNVTCSEKKVVELISTKLSDHNALFARLKIMDY